MRYYWAALFFAASTLNLAVVGAHDDEICDESTFTTLLMQLTSSTATLAHLSSIAHAAGLDTTVENATIATASLFSSVFLPADFYNATTSGVAAAYTSWLAMSEKRDPAYIASALAALPCVETNDAIAAVAAATDTLATAALNPTARPRVPLTNLLTTRATFSALDGLLHANITAASDVVFSTSFCYALCPLGFPDAELAQMATIPHVHEMHYEWVTLSDTLLTSPGVVNISEIDRIVASVVRAQTVHGLRTHLFIEQRILPTWASTALPGIDDIGNNHNVAFNLDDSRVKTMLWGPVLAALMPRLTQLPLTYLCCNECFFTAPPLNNITMTAFRAFLSTRYSGNLTILNELWGEKFNTWQNIKTYPIPPFAPHDDIPTHPDAAYWDYIEFTRARPANFFGWLANIIRTYDPTALLHIKTMNEPFFMNSGNDGIDREWMARELGIVGADTRGTQDDSLPENGSQVFDPLWVAGRYAYDWRGMGLSYPLMRAFGRVPATALHAAPGLRALLRSTAGGATPTWLQAPAFDSETHEQSTAERRSHISLPTHTASAAWLLHAGGIALRSVWFWARTSDGGVAQGIFPTAFNPHSRVAATQQDAIALLVRDAGGGSAYAYSHASSAGTLAAVARTHALIASVAASVAAIATGVSAPISALPAASPLHVCLLFSPASRTQSAGSRVKTDSATLTLAEAASFYSARNLAFVTERQLLEAGVSALDECAALLVPAIGFCADATVTALVAWVTAGGNGSVRRLIAMSPSNFNATQALICGADEWARPRDVTALLPLAGAQIIALQDAHSLFYTALEPALIAVGVPRLIRVISVETGLSAFGVLVKWVVETGGKTALVWLANVTPLPMNVSLVWMDQVGGGGFVTDAQSVTMGLPILVGASGFSLASEGDGALLRINIPA